MNITLHQIQLFIEIAKHQSITKAADALYLSQPAVSMQLKKMQEQFESPIVEIIGRQLHLTEFGKEVLALATDIDTITSELENLSLKNRDHLVGKIKLNSVSTGKYILPFFINDFFNTNGSVELKLDVTNRGTVISNLVNNAIDFAIVSIPPDNLKYTELKLFDNNLYLVISTKYNLSKKEDLFQHVPLIFREQGSGTRMLLEKYLIKKRIKRLKRIELQSNEAVKQAVLAGLGMSIIPLASIKNELELGLLKIIPVDDLPLKSTWRLVWPRGKKHSIPALSLLDNIKERKEEVIEDHFSWQNDDPEKKYAID